MEAYKLTYKPLGKQNIVIEWPKVIDKPMLYNIMAFERKIKKHLNDVKFETIAIYHSLTIVFYSRFDFDAMVVRLKELYESVNTTKLPKTNTWRFPVCYDEVFGIDLDDISQKNILSKNKIIELHTQANYTVFGIGFLPGFLYLGGLNKKLHCPRKNSPRLRIEKGAVGIGGAQTGIYPQVSPGGWNIVGNCPISLFDVTMQPPCNVKMGDTVQFYAITQQEHRIIAEDQEFQLNPVSNG